MARKIITLCIVVCFSLAPIPVAPPAVYAARETIARTVEAARDTEAQAALGPVSAGETAQNNLYMLIGSGFVGGGKSLQKMYQDLFKKQQVPLPPVEKKEIILPTEIEDELDNLEPQKSLAIPAAGASGVYQRLFDMQQKVIDEHKQIIEHQQKIIEDQQLQQKKKSSGIVSPLVPVVPIPLEEKEAIRRQEQVIKELLKEEAILDEQKILLPGAGIQGVKEFYLPLRSFEGDELGALLEGELEGAPFLFLSQRTLAILGVLLLSTGIVMLSLGVSGVFDSSGGGSGGSGGTGGGSGGDGDGNGDDGNGGGDDGDGNGDGGDQETPIPEPMTLVMVLFGIWGAGILRFRK